MSDDRKPVCSHCGSEDFEVTAMVEWDDAIQCWEVTKPDVVEVWCLNENCLEVGPPQWKES